MKLRMQPMPGYSYNSEIASSQRKINLCKATRTVFSHRTVRIRYVGIDPGFRVPSVYIRSCVGNRHKNVKEIESGVAYITFMHSALSRLQYQKMMLGPRSAARKGHR